MAKVSFWTVAFYSWFSYSKRADATADLTGAIEVCHSYLPCLALFYYRKSINLEAFLCW